MANQYGKEVDVTEHSDAHANGQQMNSGGGALAGLDVSHVTVGTRWDWCGVGKHFCEVQELVTCADADRPQMVKVKWDAGDTTTIGIKALIHYGELVPKGGDALEWEALPIQGRTVVLIDGAAKDSEEITFCCDDGTRWRMWHEQDCCEGVAVEDVVGDPEDICGTPLVVAEEVSKEADDDAESATWTYYRFRTIRGSLTIRWYGESNGYYSESVEFAQMGGAA